MNVLILGGSKGLGFACAKKFLDEGKNVYVMSRTKPKLESERLIHIETDFKSLNSVRSSLANVEKLDISVLINNSGGPQSKRFDNVSSEEFILELNSHLITSHEVTKSVVGNMKSNRFGRIINIISVTANNPLPNMIVSNTIRGAMVNWSKTLSKELGSYNITVNNVLPGYTQTDRLYEVIDAVAESKESSRDIVAKGIISQIPCGRFGEPVEFANMVHFLSSKNASYINGQSISVDGGWTSCI